jgi:pentatricopeptide repeat protein
MMIHSFILMETGLASDVTIGNTLLDMYLRYGRYVEARRFFATMRLKNVVSWSTMSRQSKEYSTTTMMEDLLQAVDANGHKPNDVTYGCILSSCRDEAFSMAKTLHQFKDMGELPLKDRVFPVIESSSHDELWTITHYNCIVDHLGHFGHLTEAMDLLKTMPHKENEIGWTSLLSSCKMYSHVGLGNQCFERVKETEGADKSSSYLLMESIYKARGMVHEAVKMESMRRGSVWNITGRATIELNNRMHEFCVGDSSHEMNREISDKLKLLHVHMKREGYMPRFELYGGDPSPEI